MHRINYCERCKKNVETLVGGRCVKCKKVMWQALAQVPGPDSPKLRTTKETYKQPIQTEAENK